MIETRHGFNIELTGANAQIYKSEHLQNLLGNELPERSTKERLVLIKCLEKLFDFFNTDWQSCINIASTSQTYVEAITYGHRQSVVKEIAIVLFYKEFFHHENNEGMVVSMERAIDALKNYAETNKEHHAENLVPCCVDSLRMIFKTLGDGYTVKQTSNALTYFITITPEPDSKNTMGLHIALASRNHISNHPGSMVQ